MGNKRLEPEKVVERLEVIVNQLCGKDMAVYIDGKNFSLIAMQNLLTSTDDVQRSGKYLFWTYKE